MNALARWAGRAVRSRALAFAVIGGAIFALAPRDPQSSHVSLSRADVDALHKAQALKLGVAALSSETASEVDVRAVEDEVLYREALRLGLDRDDALVRQHLVQKMLMLAEDVSGASRAPTEAEVRAYYDANRDELRTPARVHFVHVFAATREGARALAPAAQAYTGPGAPPFGDAFPYGRDVDDTRASIEASFGADFARALDGLAGGAWSEPVGSSYGFHLVKVEGRAPERAAPFAEVSARLAFELQVERRRAATDAYIKRALARYEVDVDGVPVKTLPASKRLALRMKPSAED